MKPHTFTIVNALMDTDIFPLKDSIKTYNYMCRILLERISWVLKAHDSKANVMLSSRGTKRDRELIHYIEEKLIRYDYNAIPDVFVKSKANLLLAGICCNKYGLKYYSDDMKPSAEYFSEHKLCNKKWKNPPVRLPRI